MRVSAITALIVGAWAGMLAMPAAAQKASQVVVNEEQLDLEPYQEKVEAALVAVDMIPVAPGSITIQTAEGPKEVEIAPFWISKTEIPWDLFDPYAFGSAAPDEATGQDAILRPSHPYGAPDRGFGHRGYAAISMSYLTAQEFAKWLSVKTGKNYRLPTEAEWEYACRAGREEEIAEAELEKYAWYWDNALDKTHPIGELEPNAFGLHDMMGNAAEWCTGLDGEPLACGGSFVNKADEVGCSARMEPSPKWQETDPQIPKSRFWLKDAPFMGFRVIRVP